MTDDMFDWESAECKVQVHVTLLIVTIKPDDQLQILTGLERIDTGFLLPEAPLRECTLASEIAKELIERYTSVDSKWAQPYFVGFFDSLNYRRGNFSREEPRVIRLVYKAVVPENVSVSNKLEWLNHGQLARSSTKLVGDHNRIFKAAFNA